MPIRGLRSEAYKTRQTVYNNKFEVSEHQKFMPSGHVGLKNVLFAPIIIHNKAVGLIGLGNKKSDFNDKDAQLASKFAGVMASALLKSYLLDTIKENETRFSKIINSCNFGVCIANKNTAEIIDYNQKFGDMFSYNENELKNKDINILHPVSNKNLILDLFSTMSHNENDIATDIECIDKHGKVFFADISTSKSKIDDVECVISVFNDVTEKVDIIKTLKQTQSILDIKNKFAEIFLTGTQQDKYRDMIDLLLNKLGFKYGLFGIVNESETLIIKYLSEGVFENCNMENKELIFFKNQWGGIWGESLKSGMTMFSNSNLNTPEKHISLLNALSTPIVHDGKTYGLILLANKDVDINSNDVNLINELSEYVAPIYSANIKAEKEEKARIAAESDLQMNYYLQETIANIQSMSLKDLSLKEILDRSLNMILTIPWLARTNKGVIFTKNNEDKYEMIVERNLPDELKENCKFITPGNCICGKALSKGEVIFKNEMDHDHKQIANKEEHGHFCTPIFSNNQIIGVLNLYVSHMHPFRKEEEEFVKQLANTLANIIEKKKYELLLKKTNFELEFSLDQIKVLQNQVVHQEKLRALGEMASGIAHEFNNQLTVMQGHSGMLIQLPELRQDDDYLLEKLNIIHEAGKKSEKIIRRMRSFYKKSNTASYRKIDINKIIKNSVENSFFRWKSMALSENIKINIHENFNELPLYFGDEVGLSEVFTNLLFNAIDAMPNGGDIYFDSLFEDDKIKISIRYTGIGMSAEAKEKCFEPFYTTKHETGSGLGMSLSYGIIERHEGTINIDSETGKGTTVRISLPFKAAHNMGPNIFSHNNKIEGLRILLVEDNKEVGDVVCNFLFVDNHYVEYASNGKEALALFNPKKYDIIISDISMPEMSGIELSKTIKKEFGKFPLILVTGFSDKINKLRGENKEYVSAILTKPIKIEMLRDAIYKSVNQ